MGCAQGPGLSLAPQARRYEERTQLGLPGAGSGNCSQVATYHAPHSWHLNLSEIIIRARIFSPRGASDQTCREHGQHVCLDPHHITGAIFASCQRRQSFVVLIARQNTRLCASRYRRLTTNNSFALVAAVPFTIERASSRSSISESMTGGGCIA